jgi:hypothetical protein
MLIHKFQAITLYEGNISRFQCNIFGRERGSKRNDTKQVDRDVAVVYNEL